MEVKVKVSTPFGRLRLFFPDMTMRENSGFETVVRFEGLENFHSDEAVEWLEGLGHCLMGLAASAWCDIHPEEGPPSPRPWGADR